MRVYDQDDGHDSEDDHDDDDGDDDNDVGEFWRHGSLVMRC